MLWMFKRVAEKSDKYKKYAFWNDEHHPIEFGYRIFPEKLNYIYINPEKLEWSTNDGNIDILKRERLRHYKKGQLEITFWSRRFRNLSCFSVKRNGTKFRSSWTVRVNPAPTAIHYVAIIAKREYKFNE
jgi:hypothetical protein